MHFGHAPKVKDLLKKLSAFMGHYVYPNERSHDEKVNTSRWMEGPLRRGIRTR
jgi:hypothetical protein